MRVLIAVLAMVLLASNARAGCFCACIDSEVKSVCTGPANIEPVCSPMNCN